MEAQASGFVRMQKPYHPNNLGMRAGVQMRLLAHWLALDIHKAAVKNRNLYNDNNYFCIGGSPVHVQVLGNHIFYKDL